MATLVLTAVGSAIGGPLGGAIGAALGQQVDIAVFAPKPREGARLKELAVQTSSYGTQIPTIFGVMRVAGTVIWATDLIERRGKSGGGKGRPAAVNYSYSVSMAVALSSRPIARIGRIWADGNLLRGAAGDLKVDTQLRVYTGEDDQLLDALMASAEAAGQCPAHRGVAYAMFEDLQLADYGNRIPSLTFEIFEREGPVPVGAIFEAATGGAAKAASVQNLRGFAVSGASAKEPLGVLLDILPLELAARDGVLTASDIAVPTTPRITITAISQENRETYDVPSQSLTPAATLPHLITLRYYDGERDFQASLQSSERGPVSRNALQIELPAVLTATEAKQVVDHRHLRIQHNRKNWRGDVAVTQEQLAPGICFDDPYGNGWRIEQIEHRFGSAHIAARALSGNMNLTGQAATPGRNISSPDEMVGETKVALVEMPVFGTENPANPVLAVFAAGTGAGWRRAALSLAEGNALADIGATAMPAIMGVTLDALTPHNVYLIDERAGLRVQLLNSAMDLAERIGSPLDPGAPYFWLDGEFMRVGNCEALGNSVYRLSRFCRGCFSSSSAVPAHGVGVQIVLIEPESARLIEERIYTPGDTVIVEAFGLADIEPATATAAVQGLATTPPAPVHGSVSTASDGATTLRWIRRSRIDSGWRDGVDQTLAEQQEQYRVAVTANGLVTGEFMAFENSLVLSASRWIELAIPANALIAAEIRQVGSHAQSEPVVIGMP